QSAFRTHRYFESRQCIASACLERLSGTRRGDLCSPLGHARQGTHAEILVALVGRYAGGNLSCDLLDDFRRRVRALPETARRVCSWRRRVSIYHRPYRTRLPCAARFGRDGEQHKSERISRARQHTRAVLCRFARARRRRAPTIAQTLRPATDRIRLRLSLSLRRNEPGSAHRINEIFRRGKSASALWDHPRISRLVTVSNFEIRISDFAAQRRYISCRIAQRS